MGKVVAQKDSPFPEPGLKLCSPFFVTPLNINMGSQSAVASPKSPSKLSVTKVDIQSTLLFSCPEPIFSITLHNNSIICSTGKHYYRAHFEMNLQSPLFRLSSPPGFSFGIWRDFIVTPNSKGNVILLNFSGEIVLEYFSPSTKTLSCFDLLGDILALGYADGTIYIIDLNVSDDCFESEIAFITLLLQDGKYIEEFNVHTEKVVDVKIKDTHLLMSTDCSGRTIFWNLVDFSGEQNIDASEEPDLNGEIFAFADGELINLYLADTKERFAILAGHLENITALHIKDHLLFTGDELGEVMVWDLNTQKRLYLLSVTPKQDVTSFLTFENQLIASDESGKVYTWKLDELKPK